MTSPLQEQGHRPLLPGEQRVPPGHHRLFPEQADRPGPALRQRDLPAGALPPDACRVSDAPLSRLPLTHPRSSRLRQHRGGEGADRGAHHGEPRPRHRLRARTDPRSRAMSDDRAGKRRSGRESRAKRGAASPRVYPSAGAAHPGPPPEHDRMPEKGCPTAALGVGRETAASGGPVAVRTCRYFLCGRCRRRSTRCRSGSPRCGARGRTSPSSPPPRWYERRYRRRDGCGTKTCRRRSSIPGRSPRSTSRPPRRRCARRGG